MKKLILIMGVLFLIQLSNCAGVGKISKKYDEFKEATVYSLPMNIYPSEKHFFTRTDFTKEVTKDKVTVYCYLEILTPEITKDLKVTTFIKIGDFKSKVQLLDVNSKISIATISSSQTNPNSTGVHVQMQSTTTTSRKIHTGILPISTELIQKINQADKLLFRVYVGNQELTYIYQDEFLSKLKELLQI